MSSFKFALGRECRDIISGFKGIITARSDFIAGCRQYCLQPKAKEDGTGSEPKWIDEERLELTGHSVTLTPTPTGGPATGEAPPTR